MAERDVTERKECSLCHESKLKYLDFSISRYRNGSERIRNECKPCRCAQEKKRRAENLETHRAKDRRYHEENKEQRINDNKKRRMRMREKYNAQKRAYYQQNKETIRQYHQKNKKKRNVRVVLHRRLNIHARLVYNLRGRYHFKSRQTKVLLGCSISQFKHYLQSLFTETMNWSNYGAYWVIDHVIPLAFFKLSSPQEQQLCFHWTNLQPLERKENTYKSDKIVQDTITNHAGYIEQYISLNDGYQTDIEKCWWQRIKLWYGKNPNYTGDFTKVLCRIIRNWESLELPQSND